MADGTPDRSPGEELRATRLTRGLELSAVAEGTKIPQRMLEAIERDEYHKLSDPLYARSFLRTYAAWLDLDPDAILRAYDGTVGRPEGTTAGGEMIWNEEAVEVRRVGLPWRRYGLVAVATAIAAVALGWLIWWLVARESGPQEVATDQAPIASSSTPSASEPDLVTTGPNESTAVDMTDARPLSPAPAVLPANAEIPFVVGTETELVLRVIMPESIGCAVLSDVQMKSVAIVWPDSPSPLPATAIEPGRVYRAAEGYVVYWGANDTFTLTLDRLEGVSAALNGVDLPVSRWRAGQPVVLDRHTLARFGG